MNELILLQCKCLQSNLEGGFRSDGQYETPFVEMTLEYQTNKNPESKE